MGTVLILGAGPRVGASVAAKFSSIGYNVAVASRSGKGAADLKEVLTLKADFTKPESVPPLFDAVEAKFNAFPNVVVYNAAALTPPPDKDSVFSVPAESMAIDLNTNTISPYVAAQHAVIGWKTLPEETKKTFIYTGNGSNVAIIPFPLTFTLGVGKNASAYWIGVADTLKSVQGARFFYADERHGDGKFKAMEIDGAAHGDFFAELVTHEKTVPWHATFVKDQGYVEFK